MLDRTAFDPLGLAELESAPPQGRSTLAGLPQDRSARIAARRAFVDMKQLFLRAADGLDHPKARWFQGQVRASADPADLLRLRGGLVAALREEEALLLAERAELCRRLDGVCIDDAGQGLGALPALAEAWQVWSGDVKAPAGATP